MKIPLTLFLAIAVLFTHGIANAQADPSPAAVKFFFPGDKLKANYQFKFAGTFNEVNIKTGDNSFISAVLFKAD